MLVMVSCTDNEFIVIDNRGNSDAHTDSSSTEQNNINFYARIIDYSSSRASGVTLFQEGNVARLDIFLYKGDYLNKASAYYKAYENGILSPVSGPALVLPSGMYAYYFISTNSTSNPPLFYNGIVTNTTNNPLSNGTDYLWYYSISNVIENPTNLLVDFKHCATQISVKISNQNQSNLVDWISYASISPPLLDSNTKWNLYSGKLTTITELDSSHPLQMNIDTLLMHQIIFPLDSIAEIPMYISLKLANNDNLQGYNLSLPTLDNNSFIAGRSYEYTIELLNDSVYITEATIAPWKEVNEDGDLIPNY